MFGSQVIAKENTINSLKLSEWVGKKQADSEVNGMSKSYESCAAHNIKIVYIFHSKINCMFRRILDSTYDDAFHVHATISCSILQCLLRVYRDYNSINEYKSGEVYYAQQQKAKDINMLRTESFRCHPFLLRCAPAVCVFIADSVGKCLRSYLQCGWRECVLFCLSLMISPS